VVVGALLRTVNVTIRNKLVLDKRVLDKRMKKSRVLSAAYYSGAPIQVAATLLVALRWFGVR
jgi:hypothetical protein